MQGGIFQISSWIPLQQQVAVLQSSSFACPLYALAVDKGALSLANSARSISIQNSWGYVAMRPPDNEHIHLGSAILSFVERFKMLYFSMHRDAKEGFGFCCEYP